MKTILFNFVLLLVTLTGLDSCYNDKDNKDTKVQLQDLNYGSIKIRVFDLDGYFLGYYTLDTPIVLNYQVTNPKMYSKNFNNFRILSEDYPPE